MPFPPSSLPSSLADRYTLERELGRGGMATVYLAVDRKYGRRVAIKFLNPEVAASIGADRFLREIRIAARLAHPHILPLIDSGDSAGSLYFVMPHVPDGSLRQRLVREKRLTIADAVRIAREVGGALDYANRQGFVHRDVKPENILFADGLAVLADFGIARAINAAGTEVVTEVGLALGTPDYMSPEQASGAQSLSGRSDIYSLACVVYEMLTGSPPFEGPNAQSIMAKQVTQAAEPLRTRRPELSGTLEQTLARALAKDPAARFATVAEFVAALEGVGATLPAPPGPPGLRGIAVLPFVNASPDPENEYLSDGITDELIDALAKVDGLRVASRTSVFALKGKPQDVRAIGALLGVDWVLEGTVRRVEDRLRITAQLTSTDDGRLIWSERYDRTLADVFAIQEELARTIVETLRTTSFASLSTPLRKRYTENVRAYGLYLKGRFAWNRRTQQGIAEAIDYFGQAIAEDPRYAPAYAGLADSYALQLDYKSVPVEEGFARARESARQALALDDSLAEAHASLAWSLFIYQWEWETAGAEFRRAVELDPRYATAHQWYSTYLAALGRHEESIIEAHAALELDAVSVSVRRSVGWAYHYAHRYEQARQYLSRAITMNPSAEETFRLLGLVLGQLGQWSESVSVLRQAMQLSGNQPYYRATLGWALANAGDRPAAEAILAELTQESLSSYVSPVGFATVHIGLGQLDLAIEWTERAREERRGWLCYLNVNPIVDPLREEPRFKALLERMKLVYKP
ncbi:MAG: protein kinase [Gemmatimonadetes bacterium]|nr:protein kinase [Gemmatimonadota bacterium]